MTNSETILKRILDFIEECVTQEEQPNVVQSEVDVPIVKSAITAEKRALFLVLEPQDSSGQTTDLHGDWYDEDTIKKACHDYNQRCERIGIMHQDIASETEVVVQESYISPCDFVTETGVPIKKGSWLMWLHFPSDDMWQKVEDGTYDSVSIECSATGYDIV